MGAALPFMMIASTVLSAVGSVSQGAQERNQANFQAQISKNNAILAERRAADALVRGEADAAQNAIQVNQLMGKQQVAAAASGQRVDVGSALDIKADTAAFGRLDELQIRNNAIRESLDFQGKANVFRAQAEAQEMAGDAAFTAGLFEAGGTVLGGANTAVSNKWFGLGGTSTPTPSPRPHHVT